VKIFNTGKIELPGMQTTNIHETVMSMIFSIIQPHIETPLSYQNCSNTILINSNFNCGFYINREALYYILKNKYNIDAIYDPCSYPGIQCKFYYDTEKGINLVDQTVENYTKHNASLIKVSFMIFRTGSVLIVGRCNEHTLNELYNYIKLLLQNEYPHIGQAIPEEDTLAKNQIKNKKIRKKTINFNVSVPAPAYAPAEL
jgi:TATA-box binding protein (TBP) (component of TFIID and TFIIIB)